MYAYVYMYIIMLSIHVACSFWLVYVLVYTYVHVIHACVITLNVFIQVNKELHSQREHQELKLSRQLEESNQLRTDYEQQLLAKQCEIHELEDMKNQLAAKEEIEERLVAEKEEVVLRLNAVQHQLATLQSRADGRGSVGVVTLEGVDGGGSDGETREELLLRELKEWTNQCQELKTRYNKYIMLHVIHVTWMYECNIVWGSFPV